MSSNGIVGNSSSNDIDLAGNVINLDRNSIFKQELLDVLKEGFKQISLRLESISERLYSIEVTIENKIMA